MTICSASAILSDERSRALLAELRAKLGESGCFDAAPCGYVVRILLITIFYMAGYVGLLLSPEMSMRLVLATVIAFVTVQAGFVAHDVGDGGVTKNRRLATVLQQYLMSFLSALSSSYFTHLHRAHHIRLHRGLGTGGHASANYNRFEIHGLKRLFAWNGLVFAVATIALRGLTFKLESLRYVKRNWSGSKLDLTMMALHVVVWFAVPSTIIGFSAALENYFWLVLIGGTYIGVVLVLNHEGMSKVEDLGRLSLLERTFATTRNLGRSWLSNVLLGGVNNHIEHHLFPEVPVMRLARARRIAESYFRERDFPYVTSGISEAFGAALRYFRNIAPETRVMQALS